jgi:ribosomal protein L21
VRKIRQEDPSFSAVKIAVILVRDYEEDLVSVSAATIGRIIKKFSLFFSRIVQVRKDLSRAAKRGWKTRKLKERKPYGLKATVPHQIIEFDMKHIVLGSQVQYAFCAIDPYLKQAFVHVASTPSSANALVAMKKVLVFYGDENNRFGKDLVIVNDNGSENMGKVYDHLKEEKITQLFARPRTPKDKPFIENFIGKLQKECFDEDDRSTKTVAERQKQINTWLNNFHFYRPHQALSYQTPQEFCATLEVTIPRLEV